MDPIFRALADPTRRSLLDELFEHDGQTLSELEARLPMTRFGVMKHLKVLEEASLVVSKRRGREKLHFLNPVPIRLVYERWVSKYAEPWVETLSELKQVIEKEEKMEKVYEIYIKTTPDCLWEAITNPDMRQKYNFGLVMKSDWTVGSRVEATHPRAPGVLGDGEILEVDPPKRLVQSFKALWSEAVKDEGTSRVTWEIEQVQDSCKLTLTHDQLREGANSELYGGWPMILSGLKTLLETGETLTTPGSLMYANQQTKLTKGTNEMITATKTKGEHGTPQARHVTAIHTVAVPVSDQQQALAFYVEILGLEKRRDTPFGPSRWIEVAPRGASTSIALTALPDDTGSGVDTGIRLTTSDAEADHAALRACGVDVDREIMRMGDHVPPMFTFRDPDGNRLVMVQQR